MHALCIVCVGPHSRITGWGIDVGMLCDEVFRTLHKDRKIHKVHLDLRKTYS